MITTRRRMQKSPNHNWSRLLCFLLPSYVPARSPLLAKRAGCFYTESLLYAWPARSFPLAWFNIKCPSQRQLICLVMDEIPILCIQTCRSCGNKAALLLGASSSSSRSGIWVQLQGRSACPRWSWCELMCASIHRYRHMDEAFVYLIAHSCGSEVLNQYISMPSSR